MKTDDVFAKHSRILRIFGDDEAFGSFLDFQGLGGVVDEFRTFRDDLPDFWR